MASRAASATHVALAPTDLERRAGRGARARRPERRRQVDAARDPRRRAAAERGHRRARRGLRVGWVPQRPAHYGRLSRAREPRALRAARGRGRPADAARCSSGSSCRPTTAPCGDALGRQPPAAERRDRAARPTRRCSSSTSRPPRSTRGSAARLWETDAAVAGRRRRGRLRHPEPRGARARRRPRRRARRADAVVSTGRSPGTASERRRCLLLRKDLRVLRRSPVLLGVLIALPARDRAARRARRRRTRARSRASRSSTRTALPPKRHGRRRSTFDVDAHDRRRSAKKVELVRMSADEAARPARVGPGRRRSITMPPGFVDDAEAGSSQSPHARARDRHAAGSRRACASRCRRSSTRSTASCRRPSSRRTSTTSSCSCTAATATLPRPRLRRARPRRDGAAARAAAAAPERSTRSRDFVHDARLALAQTGRRAPGDREPDRARRAARARADVGALGAGAGVRARADDLVPRARCSRPARSRPSATRT